MRVPFGPQREANLVRSRPTLIAQDMLELHSKSEWCQTIAIEQQKLRGQDKEYCKRLYLDMAKTLEYYGSSVFPVQVRAPFTSV